MLTIDEVKKRITTHRDYTFRENIGIYLVGGAVRDQLMGKEEKDRDYCITGLTETEFEELFPEAELVGDSFPVYLMHIEGEDKKGTEFALARKEKKVGKGHKGFEAITNRDITIEEDLFRRDLTINSMAIDLETDELIDPYGGKEDIRKELIRATSDAFKEDPLRVYRAARFAARYGFTIEDKTKQLMFGLKDELGTISGERITLELSKVLTEEKPSVFFEVLDEIGVIIPVHHVEGEEIEGHLKEFLELKELDPRKFKALLTMLDNQSSAKEIERFAILFHYFSAEQIDNIAKKLNMPREYGMLAKFLNEHFAKIGGLNRLPDDEIVKIISELMKNPLTKQAENTGKKDTLAWFTEGVKTLSQAKGLDVKTIAAANKLKMLTSEIKQVTVTKEEVEALGLEGPQIGKYLNQKRVKKYKDLTKEKRKEKRKENDLQR